MLLRFRRSLRVFYSNQQSTSKSTLSFNTALILTEDACCFQIHRMGQQVVIAYNKRNEPKIVGFDLNFASTCVREHSYRYDIYDEIFEMLKDIRPGQKSVKIVHWLGSLGQKVFKIKNTTI